MELEDTRQHDRFKWLRRLLPVVILAAGIGGTVALVKSRKSPARRPKVKKSLQVEVITAKQERRKVAVTSNGVIQPRHEAAISPEISGKVRWINPALVVGGMIRSGAPMVKIEPADYKLRVDKSRAAVALAEKNLAVAESNARVARSEWKMVGKTTGAKPTPLTLHEPQLKAAQSSLASAKADLEQAKLDLSRTTIRAPFSLRVRKEQVERGQYVRVGQELARVYGTDVVEVIVPLPVSEVRWLRVPRGASKRGKARPAVIVRLKTGDAEYTRDGVLVRSVGEVDPTGRMSKVVVAIEDPYNLKKENRERRANAVDFEIGAFVEVSLKGRSIEAVIPIPSRALRAGSRVWVVGPDNTLKIKPVTTARVTALEALVTGGLEPGERVVISSIPGAVDGMRLRLKGKTEKKKGRRSKPLSKRTTSSKEAGPR